MKERAVIVDLDAIEHNVGVVRRLVAGVPVMVVVKANGYGHGAVPVAHAALRGGASAVGVAHVTEALDLRAGGVTAPVLAWLHTKNTDFDEAVRHNIELGVSGPELQAVRAAARAAGRPARVHLKFDSGMSRNGAAADAWPGLVDRVSDGVDRGELSVEGYFSHLARADELDQSRETDLQLSRFLAAVTVARELLPSALRHIANTAGVLSRRDLHLDMVRLGLGTYGISPFGSTLPLDGGRIDLRPAMALTSSLAQIKLVPTGSGVSYGHTAVTSRPSLLGLVPVGYADGIPRSATGIGVTIRGRQYPLIGRVSMDQFVVDLTDSQVFEAGGRPHVGDEVVVFGSPANGNTSVDQWAKACDTISYELLTRVGPRVEREYFAQSAEIRGLDGHY